MVRFQTTVWVQNFSSRCRSVFRLRVSSLGVHQIYLSTTSTLSISLTVKYAWFGLKLRESSSDGIKSLPSKRQLMMLSGRKGVLRRYRYLSPEVRGAYLSHHMRSSSSLSALKLLSIARSGNRQPSNRHLISFRLGSPQGKQGKLWKNCFRIAAITVRCQELNYACLTCLPRSIRGWPTDSSCAILFSTWLPARKQVKLWKNCFRITAVTF